MRSYLHLLLPIFLIALCTATLQAQSSPEEEVKATIETLFEGMLEADGEKVAGTFTTSAIMQTVATNADGEAVIRVGELESFKNSINSADPGVLKEKILGYEIKVDGNLASAWTPYEFYVGEEFSHCGANSFQLMKTTAGWKIFHIVDTRRREGCS